MADMQRLRGKVVTKKYALLTGPYGFKSYIEKWTQAHMVLGDGSNSLLNRPQRRLLLRIERGPSRVPRRFEFQIVSQLLLGFAHL